MKDIASVTGITLSIAFVVGLVWFLTSSAHAHGGDGPEFDFAIVGYAKPLNEAIEEFRHRGFAVEHAEVLDEHETCNEHGARQEAQNDYTMGRVSAYAFSGSFDYSACGESSPCCSVWGVNGSYRNGPIPDNGYIDG